MKNGLFLGLLVPALLLLSSCGEKQIQAGDNFRNLTDLQNSPSHSLKISDGMTEIGLNLGSFPANPTILVDLPVDFTAGTFVFGGVITGVSDQNDENLGGLKLSDIPPIHAILKKTLDPSTGKNFLSLRGCLEDCSGSLAELKDTLTNLPLTVKGNTYSLDLSVLGKELNMIDIIDPGGQATGLTTLKSQVVSVDFTDQTLVFDILTEFKKELTLDGLTPPPMGPGAKENVFVRARWFIKKESLATTTGFQDRAQSTGVGYFTTLRAKSEKITRFDFDEVLSDSSKSIHYYIKHVPDQWKPAFAASFEEWNKLFNQITSRNLFTYEFIDLNDPKSEAIVAGDVRYNVLEWDVNNKAPYGGLGPSLAHQVTGKTFSANVLIQGPEVLAIYEGWFKAWEKAAKLKKEGDPIGADKLLKNFARTVLSKQNKVRKNFLKHPAKISLGKKIPFVIHAQKAALYDPQHSSELQFEDIPAGFDYQTYMNGYFTDMVAHELGHNIGLRHNFRGSLKYTDVNVVGGVSSSVMEYLNRNFRHQSRVNTYDAMAIRYGYQGEAPTVLDNFCTDEDQVMFEDFTGADPALLLEVQALSPECSSGDATNDPFAYYNSRVEKVVSLLTNEGKTEASVWEPMDLMNQLNDALGGMGMYSFNSKLTKDYWTNFFTFPGRPAKDDGAIKSYVISTMKKSFCKDFTSVIDEKADSISKDTTKANIKALKRAYKIIASPLGLFDSSDTACL